MGAVTILPRSRPLTEVDLETMPDDGHRYELLDGTLIVSPAPIVKHQRVSMELSVLLYAACPPDLEVLAAPTDVRLAVDTVLQPDLLVARKVDLTEKNLPAAPLLAIEILSPSTRLIDLNTKKARFELAGCASYWTVDPDSLTLTAWELQDGTYAEVATVTGDESWTAQHPFPVTVTPSQLA
ncbi:Uma2 family endonuclease [Nocardioides speluncae]|uniref:Uma2 family endonuclease n=1 Tax=Nocardioides speluncae TaxID=2670337 RepID=UPI000D6955FB|nr:Uma2 family endonuclease [Nocardioides speluncae]